jgi:hypothetical protein
MGKEEDKIKNINYACLPANRHYGEAGVDFSPLHASDK